MTHPITFNPVLGTPRTEAMLGDQLVGIVSRYPYSGSDFGTVQATWQMRLPVKGAIPMSKPATTMLQARKLLLLAIAQWHQEADEQRYSRMIEDLRAQAEGETQ